MNDVIIIYICAGQYRSMYTHVPEEVIDMKYIYIDFYHKGTSKGNYVQINYL